MGVALTLTASLLERQQRVVALREEERQLKISITKERERARREYLMHQKEVQEVQVRLQHLTMQNRKVKLFLAPINAERVQALSRSRFQRQYPSQQARSSPHPSSSSYPAGLATRQV